MLPHPPSPWQPITCLAKTVIAWTILNFIIAILSFDTCTRARRLILCHLMSVPGSLGPSLTCSEVFGADIDKFCTNFVQYNKHINISTHVGAFNIPAISWLNVLLSWDQKQQMQFFLLFEVEISFTSSVVCNFIEAWV